MKRQSRRTADAMNRRARQLFAELGRTPRCVPFRDWGDLRATQPNERLLPRQLPAECGTEGGYTKHRRNGEQACEACRQAHNVRKRRKKAA